MTSINNLSDLDSKNIVNYVNSFPEMCHKARRLDIPTNSIDTKNIDNICVVGMGGSGIGGDMLKRYTRSFLDIPIHVVKDYSLPAFVGDSSLLITISYSGNTKETISSFVEGLERGCKIIALTSGGDLEKKCKNNDVPIINIPSGIQPRAAFPFLFIPILLLLDDIGMLKNIPLDEKPRNILKNTINEIEKFRDQIKPEIEREKNRAKKIAMKIYKSIPAIYSYGKFSPVAYRWKCQFNENSKAYAVSNRFPEINHNEVVGWSHPLTKNISVIILKEKNLQKDINSIIKASINSFSKSKDIIEVEIDGKSEISKILKLVLLGDYTSLYLAALNGVDPSPTKEIDRIKKEISKSTR